MKLSEELKWRGFVNQSTLGDLSELDKGKKVFYHGFDASADSQAVGNLASMMFDKVFLRHGYQGILLAGGATSLIGDPGGKDKERPLQDEATVARNIMKAEEQIRKVLSGHEIKLVNNLDWTKDLRVLPFLRDVGKHFSMTPLVQRDYIAARIGNKNSGISYAEFSYTILQGFDYLHLFDEYGATLQLGGSDQWGNCLSGVELIRKARGKEADVITHKLVINKLTGKKFGKSEEGTIWLDESKTSVYQFYQFWLNVDDESVEEYLKIFTELSKTEIDKIMNDFKQNPSKRLAQKYLAAEVTKLVHGQSRLEGVQKITEAIFNDSHLDVLNGEDIKALEAEISSAEANAGDNLVAKLVELSLAASKTEARRFIEQGGISINGIKVPAGHERINESHFVTHIHGKGEPHFALVKRGKNNVGLLLRK